MFEINEMITDLKEYENCDYKYFVTDMFGELFLLEIHQYYDTPLLISLKDKEGSLYLAMCTDIEKSQKTWMIVPISKNRLDNAVFGRIELRSVFVENESGVWMFEESSKFKICEMKDAELIDENLPDRGICLDWDEGLMRDS